VRKVHGFGPAVDQRAEPGIVGDDHRGAACHGLEQRDPERRPRGRTQEEIRFAIVVGAIFDPAEELDARSQPRRGAVVVLAPRTVAGHQQLRGWMARQDPRHGLEERAQMIARLEPVEIEQPGAAVPGNVVRLAPRIEVLHVHPIGDHVPRGAKVAHHGLDHRTAHGDRGGVPLENALERTPEEAKPDRAREPRVAGADDGNPRPVRRLGRDEAERRYHRTMHVNDVELPLPEDRLETPPEPTAHRDARNAAIRVDHDARPDADHRIRELDVVGQVPRHVGADHRDLVAEAEQLFRVMVYVLGDAPELRIEVFSDQRDTHVGTFASWKDDLGHGQTGR